MTAGLILDKATILDRLGGDEEIFVVMADMFLQDCENYCGEIDLALAAGDAVRLHREAHTVKGLLATFADDEGAALAGALEQRAKAALALDGFGPATEEVKARLRLLAAALRAERGA